jgi:hypothetical protein
MNLLKTIIERLNQRVEVANIFDKQFGLCELNANGNDKAWVHYIGNGQAEVVTNFDAKQGTLFWAKRGKVTVVKTDAYKMSGCKQLYVTSFPLTAYAVVRKSHLPCDGDDAQDWLASRIYKLTSGTDPLFKQNLGVINYEVIPSGYINEIKTLTANYEWACVTVDFDIQVITTTEDGCYDICSTGDIPLPDLQPCTPCLTEVAVDGITIIGNGTEADPLSAVGGGGGAISVEDEGDEVTPVATTLNFTGAGVTASLTSPGVVEVNIPGGGSGGVGTLQEVTDLGNTTTNDIAFTASAGLSFDNGAFFRKGTTDAGNGGAKGTSQICSISYELKWEAGRLYYMQQDGFTIRDVTHNFTLVPQVTDDSTKGFVVGSRWSLDDGTVYLCSDDTIGAAVWAVVAVGGVTDVTATAPLSSTGGTTPDISITQADGSTDGYLSSTDWNTFDGKFNVPTGLSTDYLDGLGSPQPFPTIPTLTSDLTNDGADGVNPFITALDLPTNGLPVGGTAGQILTKIDATNYNATWQDNYADWTSVVKHIVKNDGASGTITKGTAVYVTGSNGTNMLVGRASNTSEATSSKTMGLMQSDITTTGGTQTGYVITEGLIANLNTAGTTAGDPVWLGVNGALIYGLINKPYAPAHLVFIGIVTKVSAGNGEIFVKVQNGFELKEIHDVDLITTTPINGHVLGFDGTLWVNKTIATWLGFTPVTNARTITINGTTQDLTANRSWTIPTIGIYKNTTDGAASSGTANTYSQGVLIPANSVALGSVLEFKLRGRKTGANAVYTIRLYANTTNNLSGSPVLLATYTATLIQALALQTIRTAAVKNVTTNTEMALATTSLATDFANTSFAAIAVDWTTDKYIIGAVQNANATDSSLISLISMTII